MSPLTAKEKTRLRALADKFILMGDALTSDQTSDGIRIAAEYGDLATFVNSYIDSVPTAPERPHGHAES